MSVHSRLNFKYVHKSGGKRLGLVKETLQNTPCSQVQVRSIVQRFFASIVALLTKEATNQTESKREKNLSEQRREPINSVRVWLLVRKSNPGHIGGRQVLSPLPQPCSPYATICCSRLTITVFFPQPCSQSNFLCNYIITFLIFILVGQKNQSLQMLH